MIRRAVAMALCSLLVGCGPVLRARGSEPEDPRPSFEEVHLEDHAYRVWVIVPWLRVNTYPMEDRTQQPMLQFTGDAHRLALGMGSLAVLVAPDRFQPGEAVTFFADRVLWTDRLAVDDGRVFSLWLRENNRSAPTRFDERMEKLEQVARVVEGLSEATGFKIPAHQAVAISGQVVKQLQQDWLILRWRCPWSHVIAAARHRLDGPRRETVLSTRLVTQERADGKPVAEVQVLFVIQRTDRPLPLGIAGVTLPGP